MCKFRPALPVRLLYGEELHPYDFCIGVSAGATSLTAWLWTSFSVRIRHFYIVITNALTGESVYLRTEAESLEQQLKASSSLPAFYRGFPEFGGQPMTDGGLSNGTGGSGQHLSSFS